MRRFLAAHRRAFGTLILQTFRDDYHDAIELEGESERRFWLTVIGDENKARPQMPLIPLIAS